MKIVTPLIAALFVFAFTPAELQAQETAKPSEPVAAVEAGPNLLKNGPMEVDSDSDGWPDHWSKNKDATFEVEEGNHFIRLKSSEPGATVLLYQNLPLPAGVEALEMTWRQRVTDLQPGKQPWFDARIMLEFRDASGEKMPASPSAPYTRKATDGWVDRSVQFLVPTGAASFVFMPTLFQVAAGTFDLDEFAIRAVAAAPLRVKAEADAAKRAEKLAATTTSRQTKAATILETQGSLLTNGNFETPNKTENFAVEWGSPKNGISWETEGENRFLRLANVTPNETVLVYRTFDVPAGVKALEMKWRQRVTGLKRGPQPWFDARIMMEFKDASGKVLKQKPAPPYAQKDTDGWVEKTKSFLVPEDAVTVVIMPALFQVKAGSFDLDDFQIKPTDPEPLIAAMTKAEEEAKARFVPPEEPKKENWPKELRVQGNRLVDPEGKEVWLQGVNIPSLEWSVTGESVQRSTLVALDQWKGNVIRLPVKNDYWFGLKGQADGGKAYRELVDQIITLAANRGAYVVLDLHTYRAPRKEYLDFWTDAAARYKNHPAVLFDLMNEPHGTTWEIWRNGGFVEEKKKEGDEDAFLTDEEKLHNKRGFVSPGMQAMLETVRATGAKNVVVAGGLDYAYDLEGITRGYALEEKGGNGIMYASHVYPWKKDWQKKFLDAAALHPILVGEVGGDVKKMDFMPLEQQEDAHTWVPDMLGLIQKHRLNWTGWCFHPSASPRMLVDWTYQPTEVWGQPAKDAISGKQFELKKLR